MTAFFRRIRARRSAMVAANTLAAITRSQAMIEFDLEGRILTANDNFLAVMGYELDEIVGQRHAMFVEPEYGSSQDYQSFWNELRQGMHKTAQFRRIAKGGKRVWIQASYNPVLDEDGKPFKIVKIASDVSAQRLAAAESAGQLEAIDKSQAIIEFDLDGTILNANANFCGAMGYSLEEIKGNKHAMFVSSDYREHAEYKTFWKRLAQGEFQSGEFKRLGKGGREVWIQASYNPIFDLAGNPYKVVKFATDVTARKAAVRAMGEGLSRMADGDLSVRLPDRLEGELEEIRQAFNQSIERFAGIVQRLRGTSGALRAATGEIVSGTGHLSERTSKQAVAIAQTTSAMQKLAATVADNASTASAASEKAHAVSSCAEQSGQTMTQANSAMSRITQSSAKISNIIGMIDDIAFQTNLLALNASVEAARAGDAGKGFAVVAVEVRRLAQSAASASADVKVLIEQSAQEVRSGSKLVSDVSEQLTQVFDLAEESADLIHTIAAASREQAQSIEQVSGAVRQMDEMTQQNAALVQQTNVAIEQTEAQARELDSLVDIFMLEEPRRSIEHRQAVKKLQPRSLGNTALKEWSEY